jgi:2-keto-4-pentenoate hydratase/2-oxohepta-3-ene-1,7-dioic acid hydratase in catechol pathway
MERRIRFSLQSQTQPTAPDGTPGVCYGILEGDTVYETASLFSTGRGAPHALSSVRWLPPSSPSKIVCVGRNYVEHAKELGNEPPTEPLIFLKPPSALNVSGDPIVYPPICRRLDYEGELGIVIGRRARHVKKEEALQYVYGYTVVNDVTARDLQRKDGQWTRAKGFDTFCVVGPWVVPQQEVDFRALRVRTTVEGQVRQEASVLDMIFSPDVIIAFITEVMTLEPGDLIATGTPSGIGPLEAGQTVRVEVSGIGGVENRVIRG